MFSTLSISHLLALGTCLCLSQIVLANETKSDNNTHLKGSTYHLDKATVTGHHAPMGNLSEEPVRVEFVTAAAIEANHAMNLSDALKYSPGLQLKPITGKSGEGIWLQGYESDRVAVLIDGVPATAGTGSSVDISQIAVGNVERIEISKGAMSAIYGSSAMGGVVNVITAAPKMGQDASITYSGGTWGEQDEAYNSIPFAKQHVKADYSYRTDQGYLHLLSDNQVSNGYRAPNSNGTQGWNGYKSNLSAKTFFMLDDSSHLVISPRIYREDIKTINDNFVGGIGNVPKNKIDITDKTFVSATYDKNNHEFGELKVSYSFEDYSNESRQDTIATSHIEQSRVTDIQHQGLIARYKAYDSQFNSYIFGAEFLDDKMHAISTTDSGTNSKETKIEVDNKSQYNVNGFFQFSHQLTPELEWLLSARINNNQKYGEKTSPMLNFQFMPNDWLPGKLSLRVGAGHGYRTPTLKELYHFFDHTHIGYALVGNENLIPESSINYQSTVEWQPDSSTSIDVTFYHNRIKDLIDFVEDDDLTAELSAQYGTLDNPIITGNLYTNIDNAMTQGSELSISKNVNRFFDTRFSYTYLKSENTDTKKVLSNRPEHNIKLNFDFNFTEKIQASVKYNYLSEQFSDAENENETPRFESVDIKTNYKWNRNVTLFAGVDNINGIQRTTFDGTDLRPQEGRYMYMGITLKNLID